MTTIHFSLELLLSLFVLVVQVYLASLLLPRSRRLAYVVMGASVIELLSVLQVFNRESQGLMIVRWLPWISQILLVVAVLMDRRPNPATANRRQLPLSHVMLLILYLAIFLGFCQYVDWIGLGNRYANSIRFLMRSWIAISVYALTIGVSFLCWRRSPRASRAVLCAGVIRLTCLFAVAAALGGRRGVERTVEITQAGNLVASALLAYGIFVGRGVIELSPILNEVHQRVSHFGGLRVRRGWIAFTLLFVATFFPWMAGRAVISKSRTGPNFYTQSTSTVAVQCDGWHTTCDFGVLNVSLAFTTLTLAGVAAAFSHYRGTRDLRGVLSIVASATGLAILGIYMTLITVLGVAEVALGMVFAATTLVGQLWFGRSSATDGQPLSAA